MIATEITAERCGRTFGHTRALHPSDLAISVGETVVLLGPSGCGKTTMLRILSGLDRPDAGGRVLFGNEDVTQLPIEQRRVGMVFQSYALFPNMSVADNVAYGPRLQGLNRSDREKKARRYLDLCRIAPLADRRIDQLSGGQRQRVALARALAAEPRALFLDEPLTALDASLRETLRDEIAEVLRKIGATAVYVTHDQSEAMALSDRIVVMSDGRIEQVSAPRDIYENPATRFVAQFVGETNVWMDGLVRPEHMMSGQEGTPCRVIATTYLGSHSRATLDTPYGQAIFYAERIAVGDELRLSVSPDHIMRFP